MNESTLLEEIRTYWIAADGLMRLDLADHREPFPPFTQRTVKNQNGVMFLAEVLVALRESGMDYLSFREGVYRTIRRLQIKGTGCFSRNPGNNVFMDSHDNMLGIVTLCLLYNFDDILSEIVNWGLMNGWVFDNLTPHNETDPENFFKALRQGKDTCVYLMAIGARPYIADWFWFVGSLLFKKTDMRLLKLRLECIKLANLKFKHRFLLTECLIEWAYGWRGGNAKYAMVIEDYFKEPAHPIRRLWKQDE